MMKTKYLFILSIMLILTVLPIVNSNSFISLTNAPNIHIKQGTSSNWAGYAIVPNLTKKQAVLVDDVKGSWIMPELTCSFGENSYSSFWVGIDGYSSSTVEQIGTGADCSGGVPVYYAWYEMYPKYPVYLDMQVNPGDLITAEVKYLNAGKFNLIIKDETTGISFSTIQKSPSAKRNSAEWIAEAPWSSGVLPLANFQQVNFLNAQVTVKNTVGSINNSAWKNDAITMANPEGVVKAQPSALSADGTSFSVRWQHS